MEIRFVSRKDIIDSLLDQMNEGIELTDDQIQLLTDFSANGNTNS